MKEGNFHIKSRRQDEDGTVSGFGEEELVTSVESVVRRARGSCPVTVASLELSGAIVTVEAVILVIVVKVEKSAVFPF